MKIFLGPGGIPLSMKGKPTAQGVREVARIGLNAMEIEFVRQVNLSNQSAREVGEIAKEVGVRLSVHAPYYINLCSKDEKIVEASKKRILDSAERAEIMDADAVAIHVAYYSGLGKENDFEKVENGMREILDRMKTAGIKNVNLGVETMGKKSQFGTLEETLKLHKKIKQIIPYIDWGHMFVAGNGKINYGEIIESLGRAKIKHINSHFSSVKKNNRGEFVDVHVPIENKNPDFEPLAKEILKRKIDITIICESPLLDHDSLRMKYILEKLGHKFESL